MLASLPRLFEDVNILLRQWRIRIVPIMLVDQLREAQRTSHPRRASSNDDDVGLHLRTVDVFERFTKVDHCISGKSWSASQHLPQPDYLL